MAAREQSPDILVLTDGQTWAADAQTVARYAGVTDIAASAYGNIVAYSPERRASNVLDGDLRTYPTTAATTVRDVFMAAVADCGLREPACFGLMALREKQDTAA